MYIHWYHTNSCDTAMWMNKRNAIDSTPIAISNVIDFSIVLNKFLIVFDFMCY